MVVGDGVVVGLMGPNGSAKTTFLRILYTRSAPSDRRNTVLRPRLAFYKLYTDSYDDAGAHPFH